MGHEFGKRFPANPEDYQLHEEVGEGVSATVYRASCIPMNEIVAIKVLDLEKCNNDLDGIRREVQTMRLIDHPNLVQAYCSFPAGHKLWVVMPYMAGGSCLHIMKFAHPEGFEEPVIATLLFEVLKALVYLHGEGHIHRDVKAGNILIDATGAVKLADFGVAACMFDTGDRQRSRNTFVGTPCWMAPEVMQQLHGYDFKADIWSFGITALELAHGHAPFSKYPPMKVLLMTLQNAPPGLDYERDRKFSKSFKEMISACLVKDPKKRPSSEKLLKHHFFKHARSREYLARAVLDGLPPLGDRFRTIKGRESDLLQTRADDDKDQLSQREYIKGISAWNFNLEDLKKQAALIEEENQGSENVKVNDGTNRERHGAVSLNFQQQISPSEKVDTVDSATSGKEELQYHQDFGGLLASTFPIRPLKALEGYFDVFEEDVKETSPNSQFAKKSEIESITPTQQALDEVDLECNKGKEDYLESSSVVTKNVDAPGRQKFFSGSILSEHALSPVRIATGPKECSEFRNELFKEHQFERNHSGPLLCRQTRDAQNHLPVNALDEPSEGRIVQRKGRFKVTSKDAGTKVATSINPASVITARASLDATSVLPILQHMLQQNASQREQIIKAIKLVEQVSAPHVERADYGSAESSQSSVAASRERELQSYVLQLQQRADYIADELQRMKLKNAQFERHLTSLLKGRTPNNDEIQEALPPH